MAPPEWSIMKKAVLFDLGDTLVHYYNRDEFPAVLEQAILEVRTYLVRRGVLATPVETMWQRVRHEDYEAADHRVRPLEERLARIFELGAGPSADLVEESCRRFMAPILARAARYPDALPALRRLRSRGIKTALVSNMPWGCPGRVWRQELVRHGLDAWLDVVVFCTDAGWRKPAPQIFELARQQLQVRPEECLFVGDRPRWDVAGARAVGMEALLIDRQSGGSKESGKISSLESLEDWL
jgi:putative hydrolase of the HAD superfamily